MITEPRSTVDVDDLPAQWSALLPGHPQVGEDLLRRWSEPHRCYHTTEHLAHVLTMINELAEPSQELTAVRLAAWFHDAVYVIGAADNEAASATLASSALTGVIEHPEEVARLIMVTADHRPAPEDEPGALLCDADLAILAESPAAYDSYAARVRAEYAEVPDDAFAAGRLRILTQLRNTALFRTHRARSWQAAAELNLDREIADLQTSHERNICHDLHDS